jgi:hypothetical protein
MAWFSSFFPSDIFLEQVFLDGAPLP